MNKIDLIQKIVDEHSYEEIDGVIVDVQTANAILTIYNALSKKNRKDFISHDISKMAAIAWRLVQ